MDEWQDIREPHFIYGDAPELFLGRTGLGPLRIVWDTCILIDYLEHGYTLWADESPQPGQLPDEVEALGSLVNLYTFCDLRLHVLDRTLTDARTQLSAEHHQQRIVAMDRLAAALSLGTDTFKRWTPPERFPPIPAAILATLPEGADRELVDQAQRGDAHVFLTTDKKVLRRAAAVRPYGLLIISPTGLVDELAALGAFNLATAWFGEHVAPDVQRVSHLIEALDPTSVPLHGAFDVEQDEPSAAVPLWPDEHHGP